MQIVESNIFMAIRRNVVSIQTQIVFLHFLKTKAKIQISLYRHISESSSNMKAVRLPDALLSPLPALLGCPRRHIQLSQEALDNFCLTHYIFSLAIRCRSS
jgi:hypothetical protein